MFDQQPTRPKHVDATVDGFCVVTKFCLDVLLVDRDLRRFDTEDREEFVPKNLRATLLTACVTMVMREACRGRANVLPDERFAVGLRHAQRLGSGELQHSRVLCPHASHRGDCLTLCQS